MFGTAEAAQQEPVGTLTGWWELTQQHSFYPGDQRNEFFQKGIMSHEKQADETMEKAREHLFPLFIYHYTAYSRPQILILRYQKQGWGWKCFLSLSHIADPDLMYFLKQMDCSYFTNCLRGSGLVVHTFACIYKSCLFSALRCLKN